MTTLGRNIESKARSAEEIRWFRAYQLVLLDGEVNVAPLERALKTVYEKFRSDGDEAWADLVLDGQDFVHGWCAPGMEIPEAQTA